MPTIDLQPTLTGKSLMLRPLQRSDFEPLFEAASDPKIWALHPDPNRYRRAVFEQYFDDAIRSNGALIAIDRLTDNIIGCSRYHGFDEGLSTITIGYTFLARDYWGGLYNGEMKRLMINHAFRFVDVVEFKIGEHNLRSRKAIEKIGAELIGPDPSLTIGGQVHLVYRILRSSWHTQQASPAD